MRRILTMLLTAGAVLCVRAADTTRADEALHTAEASPSAAALRCDGATLRSVERTLDFSLGQALRLWERVADSPGRMPRSYVAAADSLATCPIRWWASGFFPGTMWYLYEYSGRGDVRRIAEALTDRMEGEQHRTDNHDIGFAVNCSFGQGYRLTRRERYREAVVTAARNFSTRFDSVVGCTRSWNTRKWGFTVIIDNMMNLELLTAAAHLSGDGTYYRIARSHADVTMKNHYRPDYSSFHVVGYDTLTGRPLHRVTRQGYSDSSSWARGQAWGLYGFTMMYRQTGDRSYLDQAAGIARYLMNHPHLPADGIPYWDFDAPDIPHTVRDASAGAIMASALIELATMTDPKTGRQFLRLAERQLRSLCSPRYRAAAGRNGDFILMHSTGFYAAGYEIDAPLSYADYYFVEAMMRYRRLAAGRPVTDNTAAASGSPDRETWVSALDRVARPVLTALAAGKLRASMPVESSDDIARRRTCTHLEAFGRVLTGIAPWLALGEDPTPEGRLRGEYLRLAVEALRQSVDPASPDRLNFSEGRQPLVDAAFLAHGLLRAPVLWERLDDTSRGRLLEALRSSRAIEPSQTNWLLFSAMVEAALREFGGEWEYGRIARAFDRFETWYKGDGVYGDGPALHADYYNSFVIQPMMMTLLDVLRRHDAPHAALSDKQRARYTRLADLQERMISPEGTYPAVGRSLAYRFGAFQALSDAAYRHLLPAATEPAAVRSALTAVIRRQIGAAGTFDAAGWLRIGFCGHQPAVGERYISTGSLYLCCAGFIALGLPADDPFWAAPAAPWTARRAWSGTDFQADKAIRQ